MYTEQSAHMYDKFAEAPFAKYTTPTSRLRQKAHTCTMPNKCRNKIIINIFSYAVAVVDIVVVGVVGTVVCVHHSMQLS